MITLPLHKMSTHEDEIQALAASCSLPGGFPVNSHFEGYNMVDGGMFAAINLQDAIDSCREIVDDDENILIDISVCGASVNEHQDVRKLEREDRFNLWNIHHQASDVHDFYITNEDWLPVLYANPDVKLRHFILPK